MAAWQCQGLPTLWLSFGAVLPAPLPVTWSPEDAPRAAVVLTDALAWDISWCPPAPPPRPSVVRSCLEPVDKTRRARRVSEGAPPRLRVGLCKNRLSARS
jgi:hypothetical protein